MLPATFPGLKVGTTDVLRNVDADTACLHCADRHRAVTAIPSTSKGMQAGLSSFSRQRTAVEVARVRTVSCLLQLSVFER